jgi:hypothetical protein
MTALIPAPTYVLARTAWIPMLVLWHADGRFTRLEGAPCEDHAAALAESRRPIRPRSNCPPPNALGILPSAMVMPVLIVSAWTAPPA